MKIHPARCETRLAIILLCGVLLLTCSAFAEDEAGRKGISLPEPGGQYRVGTTCFTITDDSRLEMYSPEPDDHRTLRVQLWYPTNDTDGTTAPYYPDLVWLRPAISDATYDRLAKIGTNSLLDARVAQGRHPVVIFHHGLFETRNNYSIIAEHLASHGYIVVAPDHTYAAGVVALTEGRVVEIDPMWSEIAPPRYSVEERFAFAENRFETWAADTTFLLDYLKEMDTSGKFAGAFDMDRVGVVGHSIGGKGAVAACAKDERLKACVNLDGWPISAFVEVNGLSQPYMLIEDIRRATPAELESWNSSPQEYERNMIAIGLRKQRLLNAMRSAAYRVVIRGINHNSFGDEQVLFDDPDGHPDLSPLEAHELINSYIREFLDKHLLGKKSPLLDRPDTLNVFGEQKYLADK